MAGFLEIEELIADEDLSIISEELVEDEKNDEEVEFDKVTLDSKAPKVGRRMLHLVLDTHFEGLICEAYWLLEDGSRKPALGGSKGAPRAETVEERERLITLAARARKSHFTYS